MKGQGPILEFYNGLYQMVLFRREGWLTLPILSCSILSFKVLSCLLPISSSKKWVWSWASDQVNLSNQSKHVLPPSVPLPCDTRCTSNPHAYSYSKFTSFFENSNIRGCHKQVAGRLGPHIFWLGAQSMCGPHFVKQYKCSNLN